jgi:hypothetical protein
MTSIGLIVLISIDFLLLSIGKVIFYLHAFKVFSFKEFFNRIQAATEKKPVVDSAKNTVIENIVVEEAKKTFFQNAWQTIWRTIRFVFKWTCVAILVGLILAIAILILGVSTAGIWGTLLIAINIDVLYAVLFLFAMRLINFLLGLWIFKLAKVDKNRTQRVLVMDTIQFTMLGLLVFLAAFGYPFDVNNMIVIPFEWNIILNNLLSITIPMVFFALVITNILALFVRFKNILTKDVNKHMVIRLHQILFIFIASCFFGILYLTDIDFSFMGEMERTMYLHTLEVVKWIITSAFIPMFLYTLNNFKKTKTQVQ